MCTFFENSVVYILKYFLPIFGIFFIQSFARGRSRIHSWAKKRLKRPNRADPDRRLAIDDTSRGSGSSSDDG